jgi:hypothetical protein
MLEMVRHRRVHLRRWLRHPSADGNDSIRGHLTKGKVMYV